MSNVKHAAQVIVISNFNYIICLLMKNPYMCGAVLLRAVQTDSLRLFGCFEGMRAITQGERESGINQTMTH